ncbi:hypothetical protein ACX8XP_13135 [Calditrichota bacterium LG25]
MASEIEVIFGSTFLASVQTMKDNVKKAADDFKETSTAARDVKKYLSETRILIDELEKLIDLITKEIRSYET